jgi:hypothetical protein
MTKSELTEADLERELAALHEQMAISLARIEELLQGVSGRHRTIAKRHLRRFHSEQKRHLEHIRTKLGAR